MQERLLLIPGPTPVHPRIIQSLSQPTISHVSPTMVSEYSEALSNLKDIVFCSDGYPFVFSGSGTLAMEAALLNTVFLGEKILVISQGYFGSRMREIALSFGLECDILESEWGKSIDPEELEKRIKKERYAAVVCTHVDTATGVCAPVQDYAELVKANEALFVVDGVCATGGIEENMDAWGIDVVLSAAQKCFGVPPGLAVLILSESAMAKRRSRERIPAFYCDLLRWLPIMEDPSRYFSTPCVNEIRAFYEGTRIIIEEGIGNRFIRHQRSARAIRAALLELGFILFPEEKYYADTISVVMIPEGLEDIQFRKTYYQNGVVVAGGLGQLSGKVFRMGHMGNLSSSQIIFAVEALERTLEALAWDFDRTAGVNTVRRILEQNPDE